MGRAPRQTSAGIYHVYAHAAGSERLFRDDADFLRFETELQDALLRFACRCIAACLLHTHYHLIVETGEGSLPALIGRVGGRYARAHNARYARIGHAFSGRYHSVPVTDDEHLLAVFRYVVRNPVEAGVCDEPAEWPWSSYREAIGLDGRFKFVDPGIVLSLCDGSVDVLRRVVEGEAVPGTAEAVPGTETQV